MRYYHQFQIQILLANLSPIDFQIHIYFQICSAQEPDSQVWDFPPHNSLAQQAIGLSCGITTLPYPRPFSSFNFNIHQPNKLLLFLHIVFSKLCILIVQVIFIYSRVQGKRIYHYLHMHPFNTPNFPNAILIVKRL